MKKRITVAGLLIALLVVKYFISPCPGLPASFYSSPVVISSSRIGDMELETDSFHTKALIWLNCYFSSPCPSGMKISFPPRLSRYHGFATVKIPDGNGSVMLMLGGGDLCDGVTVIEPSDDPYSEPPVYLTFPGLAESLSYYTFDILTAQIRAENGGEELYGYGDGNVLTLP